MSYEHIFDIEVSEVTLLNGRRIKQRRRCFNCGGKIMNVHYRYCPLCGARLKLKDLPVIRVFRMEG